jgi:hypothetical protein
MKINILFSVISTILIFSSLSSAVDIYYDIDFSSPEHTVGLPPAVGYSPTRPSSIVFGSPIVESSLGVLNEQPLVFNTAGNSPSFYYDQIRINVGKAQSYYFVSFDVTTESLLNSSNNFSILFDTPSVGGKISFMNDGSVNLGSPRAPTIGRFNDDTIIHTQIALDMVGKNWSININGNPLYTGPFITGNDFEDIRFSLGLISSASGRDDRTFVGLDNILVANGPVPEPATLLLLGFGGLVMLRNRRFR